MRVKIIKAIAGSGALKVTQAVLGLVVAVMLARTLSPAGYGIYAFAFSLATLLAIPAQMGLPTLLVREVARYQAKGDWAQMKGILRRSNEAVLLTSVLLAFIAGTSVWLFGENLDSTNQRTLLWALVLVPFVALGDLRGAALKGLRKVIQGQLPEMLLRPLLFLVFLLAAFFGYGEITPAAAMALHVVAAILAFVVGAYLLIKALPAGLSAVQPSYATRDWMRSVIPLSLIAGMQVINAQAGILVLGIFDAPEEIGVYRVATQGAYLLSFPVIAISAVIAPQMSRFHSTGDLAALRSVVVLGSRITFTLSVPLAIVFVFFGYEFIKFVFGGGYTTGVFALAVLSIGYLFNAATGMSGHLLNMTGHERRTARGVVAASLLNVIMCFVLIPFFGKDGAAVSAAISIFGVNLYLYLYARRELKIDCLGLGGK